jgi:hypothetical protein
LQYLLELLPPSQDPQPDVLDAVKQGWKELLSIEPAAANATATKHQADIIAAERYMRGAYGPLQLSLEHKVQLRAAMRQLLELSPDDVLVQRFWVDYQVRSTNRPTEPKLSVECCACRQVHCTYTGANVAYIWPIYDISVNATVRTLNCSYSELLVL